MTGNLLALGVPGTELWSTAGVRLGLQALLSMKVSGALTFAQSALEPATAWLRRTFRSEQERALFAPWIDHNGMGRTTPVRHVDAAAGRFWRPLPLPSGHQTPVDHRWHIGASTHPGPGLSAAFFESRRGARVNRG